MPNNPEKTADVLAKLDAVADLTYRDLDHLAWDDVTPIIPAIIGLLANLVKVQNSRSRQSYSGLRSKRGKAA